MSAIFGFSGGRDDRLQATLSMTLGHRGGEEHIRASDSITIGLRRPEHNAEGGNLDCEQGSYSLMIAGHIFNEYKPAQILAAYCDQGPLAFASIRGAFVLSLYDAHSGLLRLVRDPGGERSLYYGQHAGRLFFASEPAAVLAAPGFPRALRPTAVSQYLSFSFVPGFRTMLEDLYELPAGHYLEFSTREARATPRLVRYFEFEDRETTEDAGTIAASTASDTRLVQGFRATLTDCVRERLACATDDPGVFLSGGLDSSLVAALVRQLHSGPLRTYALHFGRKYPNELRHARAVADRIGSVHREIEIQPRSFLERMENMILRLGVPIGDPVTIGNYELARQVAQETGHIFNGEGGDPCFGGPKNIPMMLSHWYGAQDRTGGDARSRARAYLGTYQRCYEELPGILSPDFAGGFDSSADLEEILIPFFEAERPNTFLKKLLAINIRLKGAHLILPKVERMTGAWGLQSWAPLFDRRMIEAAMALPPHLLLHRGVEKIVLKRAFENDLPREIIERPKSGMRVPVYFWFQGELKRFAKKILHPREIRRAGIFNEHRVKQLLKYDIEEGAGRFGIRLWMLLTFEIWRRTVVEREGL
ncbi:MAG: asparagine synthase-related protein [bacterium]|nr:asparagine synthase-related protein [bacterium]